MESVGLDDELLAGLGRFMADRSDPPHAVTDIEAAVNIIVRDWLQGQGYMALAPDDEEITPVLDLAK